jgi:hypothetical protein
LYQLGHTLSRKKYPFGNRPHPRAARGGRHTHPGYLKAGENFPGVLDHNSELYLSMPASARVSVRSLEIVFRSQGKAEATTVPNTA